MWRAEDTGAFKAIGSVASNRWWHGWRSRADGRGVSPAGHRHAHDLARLAFGGDFQGPTADFAIGDESLAGDAGVEQQFHALAAEGAFHCRGVFHAMKVDGVGVRSKRPARHCFGIYSGSGLSTPC